MIEQFIILAQNNKWIDTTFLIFTGFFAVITIIAIHNILTYGQLFKPKSLPNKDERR